MQRPQGALSGESSVNGGDDPFQQFFEDKDHVGKNEPQAGPASGTFSPYQVSVVYGVLVAFGEAAVPVASLHAALDWYLRPAEHCDKYTNKMAVLLKAMDTVAIKKESGDIDCARTAALLEGNPAALPDVHMGISVTTGPLALEWLTTVGALEDGDNEAIVDRLLRMDVEKNGVLDLLIAHREIARTVQDRVGDRLAQQDSFVFAKEVARRILESAAIDATGAVSLSDFLEMYAMETYVIPKRYRAPEEAALTHRMELSDYSLLWVAVTNVAPVPLEQLRSALFELIVAEGVASDECSVHAVVNAVVGFVTERAAGAEDELAVAQGLQQLADVLVTNPTAIHIRSMQPEEAQETAVRKMLLYCKPCAVLRLLRTLLLEDVRGNGVLSRPMVEALFMSELCSRSVQTHANSTTEEAVEDYTGVDGTRLEELVRTILLSQPGCDAGQEIDMKHFIQTLVEHTSVIPPEYAADIVVPFPRERPAQGNELVHLRRLLQERLAASGNLATRPLTAGCLTEAALRDVVRTALVSQREDPAVADAIVAAFAQCAVNGADVTERAAFSPDIALKGKGSRSTSPLRGADPSQVQLDIGSAVLVMVATPEGIRIPIRDLPPHVANLAAERLTSKASVRNIARAFTAIDKGHNGVLLPSEMQPFLAETSLRGNPRPTPAEVEAAMNVFDMDNDGRLCFEEFLSSFNRGPSGPALTKAQLAVLTNRRMSMREHLQLHTDGSGEPGSSGAGAVVAVSTPQRLDAADQNGAIPSPKTTSTKALSPGRDASNVPVCDDQLKEQFDHYDRNHNGYLERREFMKIYRSLENFGLEPTDRELETLFASVCGVDGRVSYNEFCILMLRRSRM